MKQQKQKYLGLMLAAAGAVYTSFPMQVQAQTALVVPAENVLMDENTETPIISTEEKLQGTITVSWSDFDNKNGLRPDELKVAVVHEGKEEEFSLSSANGWKSSYSISNPDGKLNYSDLDIKVKNSPAGYKYEASINSEGVVSITETLENEAGPTVTLTGEIVFSGEDSAVRPANVVIHLMDGDIEVASQTISESDGWKYEFKDVPAYKNGEMIAYRMDFEGLDAYEVSVSGTTINAYYAGEEMISYTASAVWNDNNNEDGMRPDAEILVLYVNGEATDQKLTLTEENGWSGAFTDLPAKDDAGNDITYTADVETAPLSYRVSVKGNKDYTINITNDYERQYTKIGGYFTFEGKEPESIDVVLMSNGGEAARATVTAETDWKYVFEDLPAYKDGAQIDYALHYELPDGWSISRDSSALNPDTGDTSRSTEISYNIDKLMLSATAEWNDGENADKMRPDELVLDVTANEEKTGQEFVLNEKNGWAAVISDPVDKTDKDGNPIVYTAQIRDKDKLVGYKGSVKAEDGRITIKLDYTAPVTSIEGSAKIEGADPEEAQIDLLADGEVIQTITVKKSEGYKYKIENLPAYKEGKKIKYTVDNLRWEKESKPVKLTFKYGSQTMSVNLNVKEGETLETYRQTVENTVKDIETKTGKTWKLPSNIDYTSTLDQDRTITLTEVIVTKPIKLTFKYGSQTMQIDLKVKEGDTLEAHRQEVENAVKDIEGKTGKTWKLPSDFDYSSILDQDRTITLTEVIVTKPIKLTIRYGSQFTEKNLDVKDGETLASYKQMIDDAVKNIGTMTGKTWKLPDGIDYSNPLEKDVTIALVEVVMPKPEEKLNVAGKVRWESTVGDSATIRIYANGKQAASAVITAADNWEYVFKDLPETDVNGNKIKYTITARANGYTSYMQDGVFVFKPNKNSGGNTGSSTNNSGKTNTNSGSSKTNNTGKTNNSSQKTNSKTDTTSKPNAKEGNTARKNPNTGIIRNIGFWSVLTAAFGTAALFLMKKSRRK